MRAQLIWQLISLTTVHVLFCLLGQTTPVSSKSVFAIPWRNIISNDVMYRFPSDSTSSHELSPELDRNYHAWNEERLLELNDCLGMGNCGPKRSNVVLVAARWFEDQMVDRDRKLIGPLRDGVLEYEHLRQMGYIPLFSKSFEEALGQYRMFPDLVKFVIHDKAVECYVSLQCVQGPSNPTGIPVWKMFDFELFINHFQDIVQP